MEKEVKEIVWTQNFKHAFKKMDRPIQDKIEKQIRKIVKNPDIGKPLRYNLKGERTIYVKPFRLIYAFENNRLILLRFDHRDEAYR